VQVTCTASRCSSWNRKRCEHFAVHRKRVHVWAGGQGWELEMVSNDADEVQRYFEGPLRVPGTRAELCGSRYGKPRGQHRVQGWSAQQLLDLDPQISRTPCALALHCTDAGGFTITRLVEPTPSTETAHDAH
jgi:hypothetical protein